MSPILPGGCHYPYAHVTYIHPALAAQVGYDWEYFEFPKLVTPEMIASGNNAYELVMVVRCSFFILIRSLRLMRLIGK